MSEGGFGQRGIFAEGGFCPVPLINGATALDFFPIFYYYFSFLLLFQLNTLITRVVRHKTNAMLQPYSSITLEYEIYLGIVSHLFKVNVFLTYNV